MTTIIDPTVYVDPCPGMKGTDSIVTECQNPCCDNGLYIAPSSRQFNGNTQGRTYVDKWCFVCGGSGRYTVKVLSLRARARREAKQAQRAVQQTQQTVIEAPYRAWLLAEANHRLLVADEELAYAEQARRDALVSGFVGEVGTKVRDLGGAVTVAYVYDTTDYMGYDTTGCMLLITLDNGQVVKWSSTSGGAFGWEIGARVRITSGKVKAHANYKGQDQTVLTNVRLRGVA